MSRAPRRSARDAQDKAPHKQSAKTFEHCRSCSTKDTCAFEQRCDGVQGQAGRPTLYTDALADYIVDRLAQGDTMKAICAEPDMPERTTVWHWQKSNPEFSTRLTHARVEGTHSRIERAIDTAYETTQDLKVDPEKGVVLDGFSVQRAKLIVDTELKVAAMLNPARYGQKLDLTVDDKRLDPEERDAKIAELLGRAAVKPDAATRH